jgi:hypothetical protein
MTTLGNISKLCNRTETSVGNHYHNVVSDTAQTGAAISDVRLQVQAMADKHVSHFAAGGAHCAAVCSGVVYTVSVHQHSLCACPAIFLADTACLHHVQ